jgi:hypothetical protein
MPKWKEVFSPTPKIAIEAITYVDQDCYCEEKTFEVSPNALSKFCLPTFDEKIVPYQNTVSCERPFVQEVDIPLPHCWDDKCFDHCDRLEVSFDHCERKQIC